MESSPPTIQLAFDQATAFFIAATESRRPSTTAVLSLSTGHQLLLTSAYIPLTREQSSRNPLPKAPHLAKMRLLGGHPNRGERDERLACSMGRPLSFCCA